MTHIAAHYKLISVTRRLIAILMIVPAVCGFAGTQAGLQIVILEGNAAINIIEKDQAPPRQIVVRVIDEARQPVSGATVFFQMPDAKGPGGTIYGNRTLSVMTDNEGMANITVQPNNLPGTFNILVRVDSQGRSSSASVTEANVQHGGRIGGHDRLWRWLTLGIAVGVLTALAANRSSSTAPPTPPTRPKVERRAFRLNVGSPVGTLENSSQ